MSQIMIVDELLLYYYHCYIISYVVNLTVQRNTQCSQPFDCAGHRPPELLLGAEEYNTEIDMWSVGCIFAELLVGKPIFPGKDEMDQLEKIQAIMGCPTEHNMPGLNKLQWYVVHYIVVMLMLQQDTGCSVEHLCIISASCSGVSCHITLVLL